MGKNSLANAGETGSVPDVGRFHMPWSYKAHASQLLGLCSRACTPQLLSLHAAATGPCTPKACAPQQEKPPQ